MSTISTTQPKTPSRAAFFLDENRDMVAIYLILLVIVCIALIAAPDFRSVGNWFNVLRQAVGLGVVSLGQTLVILSGGMDLSLGANMSLVAVYASGWMAGRAGWGVILPVVLATSLMGMFVGLINGTFVTRLKVPPFLATMGVGAVVQGLVLLYAKHPVGKSSPEWIYFSEGMIGPIPFPVIILAVLTVLVYILVTRTTVGRHLIATGGNEEIARLSGIRTQRIILFAYIFCGLMAALAGLFMVSRMAIGDPQVGGLNYDRFDLDSIAAVLIGGTRLGGGKGSIAGTFAGVLIIAILNNIFNMMAISTYYQWIIKGIIILAAAAIFAARKVER
jgi:ribose transport system permease protein